MLLLFNSKHMKAKQSPSAYAHEVREAFEKAIAIGRLSHDKLADNYAGHYMYMGTLDGDGADTFKHSLTRIYLKQ